MNYPMTDVEAREALVGEIYLLKKIYGYSAYELAVKHGFKGSEDEWLYSLNAYSIAVRNGFKGSEEDWLLSLSAYGLAVRNGFEGTLEEWISSIKGEKGEPGTMELHGDLDALGERIKNVADPVDDYDVVNKKYLEEQNSASKDYVDDTFVKKDDQLDANNKTVLNVATPVNDTDAVNKKYVHDTFLESAVTNISEEFIAQTVKGISLTKKYVYKQGNTVYGSISFTVQETSEVQMAVDIANKYRPVCEIVCPIMVKTIVDDSAVMYLSTGMAAYIEPFTGWIFLPGYSDNADFTNEFTISFSYLCV